MSGEGLPDVVAEGAEVLREGRRVPLESPEGAEVWKQLDLWLGPKASAGNLRKVPNPGRLGLSEVADSLGLAGAEERGESAQAVKGTV